MASSKTSYYQLPAKISKFINQAHTEGQKLVLVTGVFDLLHIEHKKFLLKTKAIGEVLLIGLESDARVKRIKGLSRPINNQDIRISNLEEWGIADGIFVLPEEFDKPPEHAALIKLIKPNVLAVSSHTAHLEEKRQILKKVGGVVVVVHEHNPVISSTMIDNTNN